MRIALTVTEGRIAPLFETARRLWLVTRERGEVRIAEIPLPGPTPAERVAQVLGSGADLVVTGGIARIFRYMLEGSGTAVMPWVVGPADAVVERLTHPREGARKISVSGTDAKPDAELEPCFGRALFHGVFDPDTGGWEFVPGDPGHGMAERLLALGVVSVVTGSMGPIATGVFCSGGVIVYEARSGSLEEAVAACSSGRLGPVGDDSARSFRPERRTLLAAAGAGSRPGGRRRTVPAAPTRRRRVRKAKAESQRTR